jgi:phospholipid/cholesterol/gamma-HCH transport system substrate-binding protein
MNRASMDLWVGIFVTLGFAALLALAMKVGNLTSANVGDTYTVAAYFDNVGSLKARAPVKSAGVVVGRVDSISFDDEKKEALVTLNIDMRYHFDTETNASILTSGLLGEQYVGLEAGGEEKLLQNGDKIKLTQGAVVLEKLISQFLYSKASETPETKQEKKAE